MRTRTFSVWIQMAARIPVAVRWLVGAAGIFAAAAAALIGWRLYQPYRLQREVRALGGLVEFHDTRTGPLLLNPFVRGRKATELILEGLPIGDTWLADHPELGRLPGLSINLSGTRVTDAGLKQLATMTEITGLVLTDTQITDSGLVELGGLPKLMFLDLSGTRVGDQGIASLRECKDLPILWLGTESTDASLRYLAEWKQGLNQLSLEGTQVTDEGLRLLQNVPHQNLRHLILGGPNMTDAGLVHLRGLKSLRSIELRGEGFSDAALPLLADLSISVRALEGPGFTDAALPRLAGTREVSSLQLIRTRITPAGLEQLKAFPKLVYLTIEGARISEDGIRHIAALRQLTYLNLNDTDVSDSELQAITGLTELVGLHLANTEITASGMEFIPQLRNLYGLTLRGTAITDAGLKPLERAASLRRVDLRGTRVTESGVKQLRSSLPECWVHWSPEAVSGD